LKTGAFDEDARVADLFQEPQGEDRGAGTHGRRHALEIEFLKDTLKNAPRPKSAITSATPAVTEGDCEKHFRFATLGSFRKNKGDPTSVGVSVSRTGSVPTFSLAPGGH
jgi:hypothetical protein